MRVMLVVRLFLPSRGVLIALFLFGVFFGERLGERLSEGAGVGGVSAMMPAFCASSAFFFRIFLIPTSAQATLGFAFSVAASPLVSCSSFSRMPSCGLDFLFF